LTTQGTNGANLRIYNYTLGANVATFDSSGNLGLGVTPSAWGGSGVKALDIGTAAALSGSGADAGLIANAYYNGSSWIYKTSSLAARYQILVGSGSHAWFNAASGTAGNAITFTEAMTLDASGNLGIGETSPGSYSKVVVRGGSGNFISYFGASTQTILGDNAGAAGQAGTVSNHPFLLITNASERARIDTSGNLLVGTTAASNIAGRASKINCVQSTNGEWAGGFVHSAATGTNAFGFGILYSASSPNSAQNPLLYCEDSTALRAEIRSNGGLANYSANNVNLSDRREKTNFASAKSYLSTICAIPVQTFNYVDQNMEEDPGLTLGVVAQDVQAVAPELVMESNWGSKDDPRMRLSIYQTDLQYALMKCIQELKAEVDSLKSQLKGA
jgi:hypothetical protein